MRLHKYIKKHKAFTLPEMLIVMLIMALVMLGATPLVVTQVEKRTKTETEHGGFACYYDVDGTLHEVLQDEDGNEIRNRPINDKDYCEFSPPQKGSFYTISMVSGGSAGSDLSSDAKKISFERYNDYDDYIWGLNTIYDPIAYYNTLTGEATLPFNYIGVRSTFTSGYAPMEQQEEDIIVPNTDGKGADDGKNKWGNHNHLGYFLRQLFMPEAYAIGWGAGKNPDDFLFGKRVQWYYIFDNTKRTTKQTYADSSNKNRGMYFGLNTGSNGFACELQPSGVATSGEYYLINYNWLIEKGTKNINFDTNVNGMFGSGCFNLGDSQIGYYERTPIGSSTYKYYHYLQHIDETNGKSFVLTGSDEANSEMHATMYGAWIRAFRQKFYGVNNYAYPGAPGRTVTLTVLKFPAETIRVYPGKGGQIDSGDGNGEDAKILYDGTDAANKVLVDAKGGTKSDGDDYITGSPFLIENYTDVDIANDRSPEKLIPILYKDIKAPQADEIASLMENLNGIDGIGSAGYGGYTINRYVLPTTNPFRLTSHPYYTYFQFRPIIAFDSPTSSPAYYERYYYPGIGPIVPELKKSAVRCIDEENPHKRMPVKAKSSDTVTNYCEPTNGRGGGVVITW